MMNYAGPAVLVDNLRVKRGSREVFHGLSLAVPRGALVGLLGPSGCGKTTLMRAIVGAQKTVSGTVTVLDSPAGTPGLRKRVGYTTQSATVYDDLTIRQNLDYFRLILGAPRGDVDRVIEETDLGDHANQ
ncbi:MAG: type transport system ATP-binding protein, partial [Microbacteriaceae bacterium]|nr:type transport system ATP-binding protein [Microbacteriaceae bacterium]